MKIIKEVEEASRREKNKLLEWSLVEKFWMTLEYFRRRKKIKRKSELFSPKELNSFRNPTNTSGLSSSRFTKSSPVTSSLPVDCNQGAAKCGWYAAQREANDYVMDYVKYVYDVYENDVLTVNVCDDCVATAFPWLQRVKENADNQHRDVLPI
uniref:Uncharacterized protein n=1 Tax=Glossina brevipalpis TaxID=37001 RepID=A0A1A9WSF5_9MUSC